MSWMSLFITFRADGASPAFLRALRVFRSARVLRLCRLTFLGDLMMMVQGATGAMKTLFWSAILISIPLLIAALVLQEVLGNMPSDDYAADHFRTVSQSFFTLFRCVVHGDCSMADGCPIFHALTTQYGCHFAFIYIVLVLFISFGLFNVITAIFVENTLHAAKFNTNAQKRNRLMDQSFQQDRLVALMRLIVDAFKDNELPGLADRPLEDIISNAEGINITQTMFDHLRTEREFCRILLDLDIGEQEQIDLFDTLDADGEGTLDLQELLVGICTLRGEARKGDIVAVKLAVRNIQIKIEAMLASLESSKARQSQRVSSRVASLMHLGESSIVQTSSRVSFSAAAS